MQQLVADLQAARRESAALHSQLQVAEAAVAEGAATVAAVPEDCAAGDRALAQLRAAHQATVLELELVRDDLVASERAAADSERERAAAVAQVRAQHQGTVGELEATREELTCCQEKAEQLRARHETAVADLAAARHNLVHSQQAADDADADRDAALRELRALREACDDSTHVAEDLRREGAALRAAVQQAQRELAVCSREADQHRREHAVRCLPFVCLGLPLETCVEGSAYPSSWC